MEFHIFHLNCFSPCHSARRLKHGFIIQPKSQLWHATQVAFQLDRTKDLGAEDITRRGNKQVQRFNHIEKDLVFAIAYSFAAPRNGVCDSYRGASLDLEFMRFLRNVSMWGCFSSVNLHSTNFGFCSSISDAIDEKDPMFACSECQETSISYSCNILLSVV